MDNFSEQIQKSYENLIDKLTGWFDTIILYIPNLIIAIIVAVIAFILSKYLRRLAVKIISRFTTNKTIQNLISNLTSVVLSVIILFIILSIFNLSSTINKILATAGVLGLAVGLALQDPLNNLFSGVFMSIKSLYNIGDLVETNGYFGKISSIDLRTTKLVLPTGQEVLIPNKEVVQNPLTNFTSSGHRRIDLECGVSYGDDLQKVKRLAIKAIESVIDENSEMPVEFMFQEFGDSSINFVIRFWIQHTEQENFLNYRSDAIIALKQAFDDENIMIPFPIRTIDFGIKGGVPLNEVMMGEKQFN